MKRIPDIRFYDFEFNLVHIENHFISTAWSVYYNDIGKLEAHFDLLSDTLPIIMEHEYLVAVQGDQAAVIVGKTLGDDLTVYGRTCNWLLSKRVSDEFALKEDSVYNLVSDQVRTAFEGVDAVTIGEEPEGTPVISAERTKKCITFDVVQELLEQAELGHALCFQPLEKKWVFRVLRGAERPLVISVANRNAYDVTLDADSLDLLTEGWYQQKQADGTLTWVNIKKDPAKAGIYAWSAVLSGGSESEAAAVLSQAKRLETVQGKTAEVLLGRDYQLGDIVRVQHQIGQYKKTVSKRIIGTNLWYENGSFGEEPIMAETAQ